LHRPLFEDISKVLRLDQPKLFHCLLSIAWRALAVSSFALQNEDILKLLDQFRPWILEPSSHSISDVQLFLCIPSKKAVTYAQQEYHDTYLHRFYGFSGFNGNEGCVTGWCHMGPLHLFFVMGKHSNSYPFPRNSNRVPPDGKFNLEQEDSPELEQQIERLREELRAIEGRTNRQQNSLLNPIVRCNHDVNLMPRNSALLRDEDWEFPHHTIAAEFTETWTTMQILKPKGTDKLKQPLDVIVTIPNAVVNQETGASFCLRMWLKATCTDDGITLTFTSGVNTQRYSIQQVPYQEQLASELAKKWEDLGIVK
jgi:hypothetical protein